MIRVYFQPDGKTVIELPVGVIPDQATLKRVAELIRQHKESPSENGSSQKGKSN